MVSPIFALSVPLSANVLVRTVLLFITILNKPEELNNAKSHVILPAITLIESTIETVPLVQLVTVNETLNPAAATSGVPRICTILPFIVTVIHVGHVDL